MTLRPRRALLGLAALGLTALVGAGFAASALRPREPGAGPERAQVFRIESGEGLRAIANRLEQVELIRSANTLILLARWQGVAASLQAGEYRVSPAARPAEMLEQFAQGRVILHEVVIPEGFTLAQIAQRLGEAGLVEAARFERFASDPATARRFDLPGSGLEGYLFPDTYAFPSGLGAEAIARAFVERFRAIWAPLAPRARTEGLDLHAAVTLASIVEKETGAAQERPLIAAVFRNRLRLGMRLETDPSVIYGIRDFDGNLRRAHLDDPLNPYNTYQIPGLPPGPIANPGAEALRAVVEPARTDYLYFVSKNDGTHVFSSHYRDHQRAVARYQRRGTR